MFPPRKDISSRAVALAREVQARVHEGASSPASLRRIEFAAGSSRTAFERYFKGALKRFPHIINHFSDTIQTRHYIQTDDKQAWGVYFFNPRAAWLPGTELDVAAIDLAADWTVSMLAFALDGMSMTAEISVNIEFPADYRRPLVFRAWLDGEKQGRKRIIAFEALSTSAQGSLIRHVRGSALMIDVAGDGKTVRHLPVAPRELCFGLGDVEEAIEAENPQAPVELEPLIDFGTVPELKASILPISFEWAEDPKPSPRSFEFNGSMRSMEIRSLRLSKALEVGGPPSLTSIVYFSDRSIGPGSVYGGCLLAVCREVLSLGLGMPEKVRADRLVLSLFRPVPARSVVYCLVQRVEASDGSSLAATVELVDGVQGSKPYVKAKGSLTKPGNSL